MSGFNLEMLGGVTSVNGFGTQRSTIEARTNTGAGAADAAGQSGGNAGVTFADMLQEKLGEANGLINDANVAAEELVAGRNKDIHGAMISLEKADVSFRMLMGVRNKMLEAYREIMRMQV